MYMVVKLTTQTPKNDLFTITQHPLESLKRRYFYTYINSLVAIINQSWSAYHSQNIHTRNGLSIYSTPLYKAICAILHATYLPLVTFWPFQSLLYFSKVLHNQICMTFLRLWVRYLYHSAQRTALQRRLLGVLSQFTTVSGAKNTF